MPQTKKIVIISGPSGSGKTSLHKELLREDGENLCLQKTISVTTRKPRLGEVEGVDYFYVTHEQFKTYINNKAFLEYEEVFGNYYGTLKQQVDNIINHNKNALMCIDVKGARRVIAEYPEAVSIFIKTSSPEKLKNRLTERASENPDVIARRLARAEEELAQAKHYRHVVINDNFETALKSLKKILSDETSFS